MTLILSPLISSIPEPESVPSGSDSSFAAELAEEGDDEAADVSQEDVRIEEEAGSRAAEADVEGEGPTAVSGRERHLAAQPLRPAA